LPAFTMAAAWAFATASACLDPAGLAFATASACLDPAGLAFATASACLDQAGLRQVRLVSSLTFPTLFDQYLEEHTKAAVWSG
jgi:hypothetical protein